MMPKPFSPRLSVLIAISTFSVAITSLAAPDDVRATPEMRALIEQARRSQITDRLSTEDGPNPPFQGPGRTITGEVVLPPNIQSQKWRQTGYISSTHSSVPDWPVPPDVLYGTAEQREAWFNEFKKTPEYASIHAAKMATLETTFRYHLRWTSPTTFKIVGVAPGEYQIRDLFLHSGPKTRLTPNEVIFTVPPADAADTPATLPPIVLPPIALHEAPTQAIPGRPAPDFALPTLDGKTVTLADFKGKYLVIDQWAVWCRPCIAEMPALKELKSKHGEKLAILGASFDKTPEETRKYAERQQLSWSQVWLGPEQKTDFSLAYPAQGIPTFWLISPSGTALATAHTVSDIEKALLKALSSGQNLP